MLLKKNLYSRCKTFKYWKLNPLDNMLVTSQTVNDNSALLTIVTTEYAIIKCMYNIGIIIYTTIIYRIN